MIPERKLFVAGNKWEETPTAYDLSKIKAAFEYAGCTDFEDTDDQYGGFKCKLGDLPLYIIHTSSTGCYLTIKYGTNYNYILKTVFNSESSNINAIEVYKGSNENVVIRTIPNNELIYSAASVFLAYDSLSRITYYICANTDSSARIYGVKYNTENDQLSYNNKTLSAGGSPESGYMPGTGANYSEKAKIIRVNWFNESMANAPAIYKAGLLTNNPSSGEVVKLDSTYYVCVYDQNRMEGTSQPMANTKIGYGSVVVSLGE